jgi:hypothetical protein
LGARGIEQVGALHVDHVLVGQGVEIAHLQQRLEPDPGQAGRFERVEIPAAALDVQHFLHDAEEVLALGLDRGVAAAMHDKIGICADESRGIDPERQRAVSRMIARRIEPAHGLPCHSICFAALPSPAL